jgi:integrase/recombinase XerD
MAKVKQRRCLKAVGDPTDPNGLLAFMNRYLDALRLKHYTDATLWNTERYIRDFIEWCDMRSLRTPQEITKPILEAYQRHLYYYRQANGQPLSVYSQRGKLGPLRGWFKWLTKQNYLLYNPASELELPRMARRLPKAILTSDEVDQVMAQVDVTKPIGVRDRAMLEVLYSTGIRRMELQQLSMFDVDVERGTLLVRQGKGKKDRIVPIGERACLWVGRYTHDVRPDYLVDGHENTLFLTRLGEPFNDVWMSRTVAKYVEKANIGKTGACHLFRHTMATLMLENGADIRYIQAMLGHAELSTTEIYTQVSIRALKEVHSRTHPARLSERERLAKLAREKEAAQLQAHDSLLAELELEEAAELEEILSPDGPDLLH